MASSRPTTPRKTWSIRFSSLQERASTADASIERAAEARHGDGHGKHHQGEQSDGVVFQIMQHRALQHDGADDADIMRQRQALADILRPYPHARRRQPEPR